jgi:hypothetical protein
LIMEIAQWLLSLSGVPWVLGETFFVGSLPIKDKNGHDVPEQVMVMLERTPAAVDGYLPDYQAKPIQIWNRARDYMTARDDAMEIYEKIHGLSGIDLPAIESGHPNYEAMTIDAVAAPAPIANPGDDGLFQFSTNYIFRIEQNPTVP